MASGGPKPPRQRRERVDPYIRFVRDADPDFTRAAELVPEYEFSSNKKSGTRLFEGYYKRRGPYAPS